MIPELFRIGSFAVSPFGVLLVLAFLTAFWQLRRGMRRLGIGDEEDASAVLFAACFGGIVGAKIYYALLYQDWRLLYSRSGLVWYGGFILATLAVVFTVRKRGLPAWATADAAAVGLALGYAVGRIGCFLVGDDYGIPSDLPWAVAFAEGLPPSTAGNLRSEFGVEVAAHISNQTVLRVHPTQIYETLAALVIWKVGDRRLRPGKTAGLVVLLVVGLLAVERFLVEFLRAKDDRFLGGLTLAQLASLGVLAIATALWVRRRSAADRAPR
jgi:phosphatidylglycerol:prolipoprotein diacylglycerol transferase